MATLAEQLRDRAFSGPASTHLLDLIAEWELLADLSFADLLLWIPAHGADGFECVAQVRPATGVTAHADDQVGQRVASADRYAVVTAFREGRIVREAERVRRGGGPIREEGIPVRLGNEVIAVLGRDSNGAAGRMPSQLESTYLRIAGDLVQMVAQGRFPFPSPGDLYLDPPRVGDGLLRLDAGGTVTFASPNAVSAYRRLGLAGNINGEELRAVHERLGLDAAPVWRVLATRRPESGEVESNGAELALRGIPLLPGGELLGAVVLMRDVTELRHRERALLSKDATIREIHHRVKNNLQTVAALLRLQGRRTDAVEAREALAEATRRVSSIALVHETLSQGLDEDVLFDGIADQMSSTVLDLAATGERPALVRRMGSFGLLPGDVATPLALVLSELLQNAVEHAYAGEGGELEVRVNRSDDGLEVVVDDDGAGLPPDFELESASGLGLQIVRSLVVGELRGTISLRTGRRGGTEAVITVPASRLRTGQLRPG